MFEGKRITLSRVRVVSSSMVLCSLLSWAGDRRITRIGPIIRTNACWTHCTRLDFRVGWNPPSNSDCTVLSIRS
jgi:hypothetical protein